MSPHLSSLRPSARTPRPWARHLPGLLALAAALSLGAPARAQSLSSLLQAAWASDPAVAAAAAQVKALDQRVEQARAALRPNVALVGNGNVNRIDASEPSADKRNYNTVQAGLQLSQPLVRASQKHVIDAAVAQAEAARAALEQARQDASQRLVDAVFELLKSRDALLLARAQKVLSEEQRAAARRKFELGAAPIPDVREAEARVDLVLAQLNAVEQDQELRLQVLQELTGTRPDELLRRALAGDRLPALQNAGVLQWIEQGHAASRQVKQALLGATAAQAQLDAAERAGYPTVDLTGNLGAYKDNGSALTAQSRRNNNAQVGLSMNIPLYTGGSLTAKAEEARANLERTHKELESAKRGVSLGVRQAYSQSLAAVGQAKGLEAALRSAELAYQANKRGYEVGLKVTSDVLDSQSRLFEAKRDLSRARYDAWNQYAKLKSASGQLGETDVREIDALLVPVTDAHLTAKP